MDGGYPRSEVLQSIRASGWDEQIALAALNAGLSTTLTPLALMPAGTATALLKVPDLRSPATGSYVQAADRQILVLMRMTSPRIVLFGGLMSDDECDELINLARARLARSETVQLETGAGEVNEARTSQGMFFERGQHPLCARLEARIAALLAWPVENGEGLQVLRYGPGAEYKPHYDYFDPAEASTPSLLQRGGQRVASLICYLNTPASGGATVFPEAELEVAPIKGNAVFFSYDRPHPQSRSLHGGAPVLEGDKWIATKWLREGRFV